MHFPFTLASLTARDNGIGPDYQMSSAVGLIIMCFISIAIYNAIELTLIIFMTFKRRQGLYFWSLLVSTLGLVPYETGLMLKFYELTNIRPLYVTLIAVGWPCAITGQSLVLYSRLHLIARIAMKGRWVLAMIIIDALICHVPVLVLLYGANSSNPGPFIRPYSIYEKVQVTIFFIQECIISGIYVWETAKMLRTEGNVRGRKGRKVMFHLIWVNLVIILLDVTLLAIEYAGYYDIQTTYKGAVYSVKLKMEFSILNRLLELFQGNLVDSSDRGPSYGRGTHSGRKINKLDTFRKVGNHDGQATVTGTSLGNSAYAKMDDVPPPKNVSPKDMEVMKTTEVTVETESHHPDGQSERDMESMASAKPRTNSASSSEIQIVRNGY